MCEQSARDRSAIPFRSCRKRTLLRSRCLLVLLAPTILMSQVAAAQVPTPETKKMCSSEMRSRCLRPWRFTPAGIMKCVDSNRQNFSPACQGFLDTAKTCQAEMKVVCGGLNPFKIKSCLANSGPKFSDLCRQTLGAKNLGS